ncbi:MAG: squalene/phytoene synthase family protein [Betaproteobacteria bacterium]|nr:squalene/phytoene synthase family protein [Betaproteobacteria bacterium]
MTNISASPAFDTEFQAAILPRVSRTFALTIPLLPRDLAVTVANAYLLCRIADTIEDEPALGAAEKRHFSREFIDAVAGYKAGSRFAEELVPLLSAATPQAERELVLNAPRIIGLTRRLPVTQRRAMERCVTIMATGMAAFQARSSVNGLRDQSQMDRYCYFVAGVVGEMLTELFCVHSPAVAENRAQLMKLAVSFGQGLQMTNILKDLWEDRRRGACWLPREIFSRRGIELSLLAPDRQPPGLGDAIDDLVATAHGHLRNALTYTLLIPPGEAGIRRFCFWAVAMALLTLRNIHRRAAFSSGKEVKISRPAVKVAGLAAQVLARTDTGLKIAFALFSSGLSIAVAPKAAPGPGVAPGCAD